MASRQAQFPLGRSVGAQLIGHQRLGRKALLPQQFAHELRGRSRVASPLHQQVGRAIYTRVSTEQGLEQEFNSLDNQREASEAYIKSQAHEGWRLIRNRYGDGGFSGGSMDRPALKKLLDDIRARRIDVIVVYKVDRLTRSLADFAKLRARTGRKNGRGVIHRCAISP